MRETDGQMLFCNIAMAKFSELLARTTQIIDTETVACDLVPVQAGEVYRWAC